MQEEIAKMLTANNPAAPKNTARFNMKERVYKLEPMVEQLLVHYATDGWLLHKASEDARKQQEVEKQTEEAAARFQAEVLVRACHTALTCRAGTCYSQSTGAVTSSPLQAVFDLVPSSTWWTGGHS